MYQTRSVRAFKVIIMAGGLLALSCPKGWSAHNPVLFTESWNDKVKCVNDQGDVFCNEISAGKFTVKAVIPTSALSPQ